jgi:glycosyltransferase involved in cell wall biosynthesis
MNILVIDGPGKVPHVNGKYYYFARLDHLPRYSPFGKLTLCSPVTNVIDVNREVDLSDVNIAPIHKINTLSTLFKYTGSNRKIIRREVEKADAVVAYVPSDDGFYAQKVAQKLHKPCLMIVIACPWDALWNHSWKGKLMAPISYLKMKRGMKRAQHSVYVTQHFLQNRYPTDGKSVGVSNVIIQEPNEETLKDRLDKIGNTIIDNKAEIKLVTTAAVYVRYKAQDDVIKAISLLKNEYNLHYYLIGKGDQTYLKSVAEKYNVTDRVHFVGSLPHEQVFDFLKDMDVYIQPSKQEGLPRAVVEAMSLALPALGSSIAGIPELLSDEFMFKKGNINQIADRIRFMLDKDVLKKAATDNFNKSKEYTQEVLDQRRSKFIKMCFDGVEVK